RGSLQPGAPADRRHHRHPRATCPLLTDSERRGHRRGEGRADRVAACGRPRLAERRRSTRTEPRAPDQGARRAPRRVLRCRTSPAHRMSVRRAEDLVVIHDSDSASPAAVAAALAVLGSAGGRRVAVLGDMLELGTLSADAHEEAGRQAATKADVLVGIGDLARTIVSAARTSGMRETYTVADAAEALMLLRRILRRGDTVLVKGSHSLALDRLADALARPSARIA